MERREKGKIKGRGEREAGREGGSEKRKFCTSKAWRPPPTPEAKAGGSQGHSLSGLQNKFEAILFNLGDPV